MSVLEFSPKHIGNHGSENGSEVAKQREEMVNNGGVVLVDVQLVVDVNGQNS